jgi:hypothetical protein
MKRTVWIAVALTLIINATFAAGTSSPQRVVVDPKNPGAASVFHPVNNPSPQNGPRAHGGASVSFDAEDRGLQIPWESNLILHAPSGQDSFLVTSSRKGCPGTEVKPSVSVAFATAHGWSDPPIRFGPLAWKTICPLGRGVELQVCVAGGSAPYVKLIEKSNMYGKR